MTWRSVQVLRKNYDEVPWYWYVVLLLLSFFAGTSTPFDAETPAFIPHAGLIVIFKGETMLPWWAHIVALFLGGFIPPFATLLSAWMGKGIVTIQVMKMIASAANLGKPVANLYVCFQPCLPPSRVRFELSTFPPSSRCGVTT